MEGQSTSEVHHPRGFVRVSGEHKRRNSDLIMGWWTRNCEVEVDRDIVLFDIAALLWVIFDLEFIFQRLDLCSNSEPDYLNSEKNNAPLEEDTNAVLVANC